MIIVKIYGFNMAILPGNHNREIRSEFKTVPKLTEGKTRRPWHN